MRTIDADELKKKLEAEHCDCEIMAMIDNMPAAAKAANAKATAIIEYYGAQHQLLKLAEECAELIQQCMKCFDINIAYHEDFVEELADVKIMLTQFESILTPAFAELYEKIIREKLDRQIERIESGQE
jgi:fructose/tagatose bisphosphate aldolase